MNHESIFDFLKSDVRFLHVYDICVSMEKSIIGNSYNASLILSRTASELIMKLLINDSDYLFDFYKKNKYCDPIINKRGEYVYIPFSKIFCSYISIYFSKCSFANCISCTTSTVPR